MIYEQQAGTVIVDRKIRGGPQWLVLPILRAHGTKNICLDRKEPRVDGREIIMDRDNPAPPEESEGVTRILKSLFRGLSIPQHLSSSGPFTS